MSDTRTLGTMITRIVNEVRRDGQTANIRNAIASAEDHYRDTRFWFNETEATASISTGTLTLALPTDFKEMDELVLLDTTNNSRYGDDGGFRQVSWDLMSELETDSTSRPSVWAIRGDNIHLWPASDKNYAVIESYMQELEISASATTTTTNAWLTHGEKMIRSKAKADLFDHVLRNPGMADRMEIAAAREQERLISETTKRIATGTLKKTPF